MSELNHECGVAAIYHLPGGEVSPLCTPHGPDEVSRLMPRLLLDIQNRGAALGGDDPASTRTGRSCWPRTGGLGTVSGGRSGSTTGARRSR